MLQENDIENLQKANKYIDGPCVQELDVVLKSKNVQRQAYHGKSFIGNHVHKMLKVYSS